MALHSVENLPATGAVRVVPVNMESFLEIVDSVGGVTVENPSAFEENGYQFAAGPIHLNGDSALSYVRMRKNDPLGDFGRQERQKQVLLGILKEGASFNSLLNYKELLKEAPSFNIPRRTCFWRSCLPKSPSGSFFRMRT